MRSRSFLRGTGHTLATMSITGLLIVLVYIFAIRPWLARWGATDAETGQALPGDLLVAAPENQTTRAISINAPIANVWPWLVQMGQGRGGLYSYEMLENILGCDMHNADTIVAGWQNTAVGDRVRMYPEGSGPPPYTVAQIIEERALIMGHTSDAGGVPGTVTPQTEWTDTWAFVLEPLSDNSTRLILRSRSTYADPAMNALMSAIEPGYFIMERGMLVGIKERAERISGIEAGYGASDGWGAACLVTALAGILVYLFAGKWPLKVVIFPVAMLVWVMVLFFGYSSLVLAGIVAVAALATLGANFLFAQRSRQRIYRMKLSGS